MVNEDPVKVEIILRRPETEDLLLRRVSDLRSEVTELFSEIDQLRGQLHEAEVRLGFELQINLQLTDLLRQHGISFRPSLDRRKSR